MIENQHLRLLLVNDDADNEEDNDDDGDETEDLVTFTEEILNGKLHFFAVNDELDLMTN